MNRRNTRRLIVDLLSYGGSRSQREIASELGLDNDLINAAIFRAWEAGAILRSEKPYYESRVLFTKVGHYLGCVLFSSRPSLFSFLPLFRLERSPPAFKLFWFGAPAEQSTLGMALSHCEGIAHEFTLVESNLLCGVGSDLKYSTR